MENLAHKEKTMMSPTNGNIPARMSWNFSFGVLGKQSESVQRDLPGRTAGRRKQMRRAVACGRIAA